MSVTLHQVDSIKGLRLAGWLLVVVPLLSLLVLAHHPTIAAHDAHEAASQLGAIAAFAGIVHGTLIAMQCALLYALLTWLVSRDLLHALPRAAAVMLVLGAVGVIGAALIDGFMVARVATFPHDGDPDLHIMDQLIRYSMSLNQVLIVAGEAAMSVGFACLSVDLLGLRGGARWVGAFGLVLGIASLIALLTGRLVLHLHGMQWLFAAQSVWMICLGVVMLRTSAAAHQQQLGMGGANHIDAVN
jgi:hypothetical protein